MYSSYLHLYVLRLFACDSSMCAILGTLSKKNVFLPSSSSQRQVIEFLPRFLACDSAFFLLVYDIWPGFFVFFHIVIGILMRILGDICQSTFKLKSTFIFETRVSLNNLQCLVQNENSEHFVQNFLRQQNKKPQ
jgi:hypothetical protein